MVGSWMMLVSLLRVLNSMKNEKDCVLYLILGVSEGIVLGFLWHLSILVHEIPRGNVWIYMLY
jgi:hypothetical protein